MNVRMYTLQAYMMQNPHKHSITFVAEFGHLGCWKLNYRTGRLITLEGRNPDLSDSPFIRVNPVGKCGLQAEVEKYNYFALPMVTAYLDPTYCLTISTHHQSCVRMVGEATVVVI